MSVLKKDILEVSGGIPVVFEGLERNYEKSTAQSQMSRHDFHELIYVRDGEVDFFVEGEEIPLHRRSTIIVRPQSWHRIHVKSSKADIVGLYFGFAWTISPENDMFAANGYVSFLQNKNGEQIGKVAQKPLESFLDFAKGDVDNSRDSKFLKISGKSSTNIRHVVERIVDEWGKDAFAKDMMMQFLTMELLVVLSRALREEWEESLRVRLGKARELVLIARDFLMENHDRGVTVADAAAFVFLSQGYFTRAFRDELGISPMNFLMQVRVDHACKLLVQEEIKVSGVALQVGFSSPQRFNVAFRKHMNMTPIQYRQSILSRKKDETDKSG